MSLRRKLLIVPLAFACCGLLIAADPVPMQPVPPVKPVYGFSTLKAMTVAEAKPKLEAWLKSVGKFNRAEFNGVWTPTRSVGEAVLEAIGLGLPESEALISETKRAGTPPTAVPAWLSDAKLDPFVRSNVAAAYAKALASKRAYEESLTASKSITPELLVDPASYFFHKAVAEHATMQRDAVVLSVSRLLDDVPDAPDRYRVVGTMMFLDVQQWSKDDKDLANITRLMDNSGRRLDLARGGPQTQEIQKKIVFRLDEKIKQLENEAKKKQAGKGDQAGGKSGKQPGEGPPSTPMEDSMGGTNAGPGQVDLKKMRNYEAVWAKLPELERKKITQDFVRSMPKKFEPMIEDYFRSLNRINGFKP